MAAAAFLIMWLALAVLSVFFAADGCARKACVCGCDAANACRAASVPLCTLCGIVLVLFVFGCAGVLRAGAWAVLVCAAAAAVRLAVLGMRGGCSFFGVLRARCCTPAWYLTFGGSALLAALLAAQQPLFMQWDEFSFWGTAAKTVWQNDALYTLAETTNLEARTYPPAAALLSYAFGFLSDRFAPWTVYAAYGVMAFAVFGAAVGLAAKKNTAAFAFGSVLCVLAPFAVESFAAGQTLTAYATAYADHLLGLLTAGGCAVWLGAARCGGPLTGRAYAGALVKLACVTAVLGLTKDVGLPLGLVVFLVCVLDHFGNDFLRHKKDGRAWLRLLGAAAVPAGTAVLTYLVWAKHLAAVLEVDRSYAGGSAGLSTAGMLAAGVRELLGIGRTEHFSAVFSAMVRAFFARRVSVFGSGMVTVSVIMAIFALAFVLEKKGQRRRTVCLAAASGVGFAGYYFFQLLCYVYVFSAHDGLGLVSYPRYMGIYYLFWLLAAVCALLRAVNAGRRLSGAAVIAAAVLVLAVCGMRIDMQDTFAGRGNAAWQTQTVIERRAQQALDAVREDPTEEKALLVAQWDDGGRWYRYAYALEPLPLYHAKMDNTIVAPGSEEIYPIQLDAQTIGAFLAENGITLLILDVVDYDFWMEFRPLFTDGMHGYEAGLCHAYRVQSGPDGGVRFVPCTGETEAANA